MISCVPVPILKSNYCWLIQKENSNIVYIVDPGEAIPVHKFIQSNNLIPAAILITHSHRDHVGGINYLLDEYDIPVIGPQSERIDQVSEPVHEGDTFLLWDDLPVQVMETPGHLVEHICFYIPSPLVEDANSFSPKLLCGDMLFSSGCGRNFEGTSEEFHHSLSRFAELPTETEVCCAHEYTLANIEFALEVEPNSLNLKEKKLKTETVQKQNHPSLPSTIGEELLTNPFLRCHEPAVKLAAEAHSNQTLNSPVDVFAALRSWKDTF